MLDMTLEQGQHVFLKALAGNNFSIESIRAYSADIASSLHFLSQCGSIGIHLKKLPG